MRTYPDNYKVFEDSASKEPRFVVQVSWDKDDTDHTYLTSNQKTKTPAAADVIEGAVYKISGLTQQINPDIAASTIGKVNVSLMDVWEYENLVTQSEDFSSGNWQKSLITATADQAIAPNGTLTADEMAYSNNFSFFAQSYNTGSPLQTRSFTFSVWLWVDAGQKTSFDIRVYSASNTQSKNITLTTRPQRYTVSYEFPAGDTNTGISVAVFGPSTGGAGVYYAWGAQLSETGGKIHYTKVGATRRTTSYPAVTTKISDKLTAGDGLREKIVRVYVGYVDMPFSEYDLRVTYIVDSINYMDGMYKLSVSDIQRAERHKIFTPKETTLIESIDADTSIIPVSTVDLDLFRRVRTARNAAVSPQAFVGYVKIEDEVIQHTGITFTAGIGNHINATKRGALNTRPAEHNISDDTSTISTIKVIEHIYFEAPAPKAIYALQTGLWLNGDNILGDEIASDSFDLSTWNQVNSPTVALSTEESPTGWGQVWDITDNSATLNEHIATDQYTTALGYVHGNECSGTVFVKKNASDTTPGSLLISFNNGAASSYGYLSFNISTGAWSALNDGTAFTFTQGYMLDFGEWWQIVVSGFSTTTGTTSATLGIYPAGAASATATKTYFGASFQVGVEAAGMSILPLHWHLGINEKFVRLSNYKNLGVDFWNPFDDSGKKVRVENPGTQDGKRYIEKELLLWLGAFMPVYSDGQIGIKRLANVLPFTGYNAHLTDDNVKKYSSLTHDMKSVLNDIRILWNYVDSKEKYTKQNIIIDADSIAKHQTSDTKTYEFKTVHTGAHTDENIIDYFNAIRDRYAGPPLKIAVDLMPSSANIEVGDRVRLTLDQIRNFSDVTPFAQSMDRVFEVQQVTTDWTNGAVKLRLFGSSQKAGEVSRSTINSVLLDTFYTDPGPSRNLTNFLTISGGAVTANGSLTGGTLSMSGGVYYYDGDLTINPGVTVTITGNVQLRIKGAFTVNGDIDGVGGGPAGGAGTSQFVGGSTVDIARSLDSLAGGYDPLLDLDFDHGSQGYLFNTVPAAALNAYGNGTALTIQETDKFDVSAGYVNDYVGPYTVTIQKAISEGVEEEVPYFGLSNDQQTNTLIGYSQDLRGNSGGGGVPLMRRGFTASAWEVQYRIVASGGAGGAGGAGLMIISRGMSFGGAGKIDLSGGDSSAGASFTSAGGDKFYAGSGAPGAPGGLLILLDGFVTQPDIDDTKFIANFGDAAHAVGATEIDRTFLSPVNSNVLYTVANWPHGDAVWNAAPTSALENVSATPAAHRIQYIPPDLTPEVSEDSAPNIIYRTFKPIQVIEGIPTNQATYLGKSAVISKDNQRWAYSTGIPTGGQTQVKIINGLENGLEEHNITIGASEDADASRMLAFNDEADVFIEGRPESSSSAGAVYVWTRLGNQWTNSQTLTWGTANARFGYTLAMRGNGRTQGFIGCTYPTSGNHRAYYFENTGASWVQQQTIDNPGQANSLLALNNAVKMSADANWLILGDTQAGASGQGCAVVWERTGTGATTWTFRKRIEPAAATASDRFGDNVAVDATGQTFVIGSEYLVSGFKQGKVEVWERDFATYNLLQTIYGPAESVGVYNSFFGHGLALSDDGLIMVATHTNSGNDNTTMKVYKRGSIDVKFKLFETIVLEDFQSSYTASISVSRNGNYIIIPSPVYRSDGTNTNGCIVIFENQFRLEGA